MTGTALSPAASLMKLLEVVGKNPNGASIGKKAEGSSLFSESLGQALLKNIGKSQADPKGLKQILAELMNLMKKNPSLKTSGKSINSSDAEKMVKLLLQAVQVLKVKKKGDKKASGYMQVFQTAISQIQILLSHQTSKDSKSVEATKLKKTIEQVETTIKKLMATENNSNAANQKFSLRPKPTAENFGTGQQSQAGKGSQTKQEIGSGQLDQPSEKAGLKESFIKTSGNSNQKDPVVTAFQKLVKTQDVQQSQPNVFHSGPMSKVQQFVLHVKQTNGVPNQQQFVKDFEQLLSKGTFTNIGGKQQLTLQLHPKNLGTLNIELTRANGQLTATLVASTNEAKNLVQSSLHQLQGALASQNLNVQKLQVVIPFSQQDTQQHGQNYNDSDGQQQQQKQENEQQNHSQNEDEDTGFSKWLEQMHLHTG